MGAWAVMEVTHSLVVPWGSMEVKEGVGICYNDPLVNAVGAQATGSIPSSCRLGY